MRLITDNISRYDIKWWDDHWSYKVHKPTKQSRMHHRLAAEIIGDGSVLDVGCGEAWFAGHFQGGQYTGLDWSPVIIERVRKRFPRHEFLCCDLSEIDGVFDYVTAFEVFEHIEEPRQFVEGLLAHARQAVIIALPNGDWGWRVIADNRKMLETMHGPDIRYHYATYDRADIVAMFPETRFVDVDKYHLMFVLDAGKG